MARLYKELRRCRMCKKMFELKKDKTKKQHYSANYYCPACCKKYFKGKK